MAVGAVLAVVGAVLWLVPLSAASSSTPVAYGQAYDFGVPGSLEVGSIPYTAHWTMSSDGSVTVYSCGTDSNCPQGVNATVVARGTGTTGAMSWSSRAGQYYLLVPNATANITIDYKEPFEGGLVGMVVLGVGILVAVAAAALPSRPKGGSPPT